MTDYLKPSLPFRATRRGRTLNRPALLAALLAGVLLTALPAQADSVSHPEGWGLGVAVGSPTGLTAKKWLGGADAWDLGLGIGGFGFNPGFRLHADYLWGLAQVLPDPSAVTLDIYLGVGPVVGFGYGNGSCRRSFNPRYYDDCGDGWLFAGARVPLGLDLRFERAPIELALEIAPGAVISRNYLSGLFEGSLIARFLF